MEIGRTHPRQFRRRFGSHLGLDFLVFAFSLFAEHSAAHLEHGLESLTASLRILAESLDASFFDLVLDLLPSTAEGSDLGLLLEVGFRGWHGWRRPIDDGFANIQDV